MENSAAAKLSFMLLLFVIFFGGAFVPIFLQRDSLRKLETAHALGKA
jgi:hypothetical protein